MTHINFIEFLSEKGRGPSSRTVPRRRRKDIYWTLVIFRLPWTLNLVTYVGTSDNNYWLTCDNEHDGFN
jgi:hypothetical protein